MNRLLFLVFLLFTLVLLTNCTSRQKKWTVTSPDKNLTLELTWQVKDSTSQELSYRVTSSYNKTETEIIHPSPLGITRKDENFSKGLLPDQNGKETTLNESYHMFTGKQSEISCQANELSVGFRTKDGKKLMLDLRAYNDGVAFRYRFPENDSAEYTVTGELTGFNIPVPGKCWMQPYDNVTQYSPAYETYYQDGIDIGTKSPLKNGWAFPALFQTGDLWMLVSEAGLGPDFYAAHLQPKAENGLYKIRLPEKEEALGKCSKYPSSTLPWSSPWRFIEIGQTLSTIVESSMVNNLSRPSVLKDTSWIVPGKASWSWWSDPPSPRDYRKLLPFVDLAKEMGWKYTLVDANWNKMKNGSIEDLVKYADSLGVGVWLWYNSGGPYNTVTEEPRNRLFTRDARRKEFEWLSKIGVKGIKVDFFQSDKPDVIKLYQDILRDAADFRIMVNFHGCTIPRGWARTYPNNLSCEAVKGAENYQFDKTYPEEAPVQNVILPFTRNVVGSMDYTPVTFSNQTNKHLTTYAHELALSVVFESGIEHFADKVSEYLLLPDFAKKFLSEVPNTWDQTRFIEGFPGKNIEIAREKNGTWYVGGINGLNDSTELTVSLPFINDGTHLLEVITDGDKDGSFMYYKKPFDKNTSIPVTLKPRGGFVARLIK